MTRIIVTSNCQTAGIALCLRTALESADVQVKPIGQANRVALSSADVWVTAGPEAAGSDLPALTIKKIPIVIFSAFHPDVAYASVKAARLRCLSSDYHSAIVLWSWCKGLSSEVAQKLFNRDVFSALGYLDRWNRDEAALRSAFLACGLDFKRAWSRIKRDGIFMYAGNHPKLSLLSEIAKQIAVQLGANESIYEEPLHEILPDALSSVIWPVYPSIAGHFGVQGMYRWRIKDRYINSLSEYISSAYQSYEEQNIDRSDIKSTILADGNFDRILQGFVGVGK